jgi:hypothetical protein
MNAPSDYPVSFDVDYPEEPRDRLSVAFRIIVAIPIAIVISAISGGSYTGLDIGDQADKVTFVSAGGVLFLGPLLMIVFRQKYPRWWFDWNLMLTRFSNRVGAFLFLLRDEYPSTDEEQAVHLEIEYPNVETDLNRWLPVVKWFLAIPHYIVLLALGVAVIVVTIIAWFAILFTGQYPRGMFNFMVGVGRWALRVEAYAILLTTDKYPPFSLDP